MNKNTVLKILDCVQNGTLTPDEALTHLKYQPFEDLGFAKLDYHRELRQGVAEVIYGEGKTPEQIAGIVSAMQQHEQQTILITRLAPAAAETLQQSIEIKYHETARFGLVGAIPSPDGLGSIVIASGGTSDMPVAEEAALTAEALGNQVVRLYDVGVAGIHRLFSHVEEVMSASVIVAVAGMEGALASVVGGIADCPVIAVPTSVGYGANLGGVSALLSMLNSCASGVSVVNIDNGFGAGYQAHMINHPARRQQATKP